jgi:methyl halide transferase
MQKGLCETPLSLPDYWSGRYQRGEAGWDNKCPHPYLREIVQNHPQTIRGKNVLVIGAGPGHDAEFFLNHGAEKVTALDFSEQAKESFLRYYPHSKVEYILMDFFNHPPSLQAETVFEHTLLCAIDPFRHGDYFKSLKKILSPGGYYLAIIWNQAPGGKEGPPFSIPNHVVTEGLKGEFEILLMTPVTKTISGRENTETFFIAQKK